MKGYISSSIQLTKIIKARSEFRKLRNFNHNYHLLNAINFFNFKKTNSYEIFDTIYKASQLAEYCDRRISKTKDIKDYWEFSRLYFLPSLALNGDTEIIQKIFRKRACIGYFHWGNAMEASIRGINLSLTYQLIHKDLPEENQKSWIEEIFKHGVYIWNNLEKMPTNSNNHYLADLLGLLWIGANFKDNKYAQKWINFASKEFEFEIIKQFKLDGFTYEGATNYQLLDLEILLLAKIIDSELGMRLSKIFDEKLIDIIRVTNNLTFSDGIHLNIGDTDSGKIIWLDWDYRKDSVKPILTLAKSLYPHVKIQSYNLDYASQYHKLFSVEEQPFNKTTDINAYYSELKTIINKFKNNTLVFWTGIVDKEPLFAEHKHSDMNQVLLELDGQKILVDSGSFRYNRNFDERKSFVIEKAHNTIEFRKSQREMKGLFHKKNRDVSNRVLITEESKIISETEFKGITWKREVINNGFDEIIINDYANEPGRIIFILQYDLNVKKVSEHELVLFNSGKRFILKAENEITINKHEISNEYGKKLSTSRLFINFSRTHQCQIIKM
jgi:hypothetical protein